MTDRLNPRMYTEIPDELLAEGQDAIAYLVTFDGRMMLVVCVSEKGYTVDAGTGALDDPDIFLTGARAAGADSMAWPPDFTQAPEAGWSGRIDLDTDEVVILLPGMEFELFDGKLPIDSGLHQLIAGAARRNPLGVSVLDIPVVTGDFVTMEEAEAAMTAGDAVWAMATLTVQGWKR